MLGLGQGCVVRVGIKDMLVEGIYSDATVAKPPTKKHSRHKYIHAKLSKVCHPSRVMSRATRSVDAM